MNRQGPPEIATRTKKFAIQVIKLANDLPRTPAGFAVANQFVRSGTSIGANVIEAQESVSRAEFTNKLAIAAKEALETQYWLEIMSEATLIKSEKIISIKQECDEITKILRVIVKKSRNPINH